MNIDVMLLAVAVVSFLTPLTSIVLEKHGYKRLTDYDYVITIGIIVAISVMMPWINDYVFHFGGYFGLIVAWTITTLFVFIVPVVASLILAYALGLLTDPPETKEATSAAPELPPTPSPIHQAEANRESGDDRTLH